MKKSIIIYADCIAILEELTDTQAGRLFKAILAYVNEEPVTEITNDPAVKMAFVVLKKQIDRDTEKYEEICRKRSEAGKRHKGNQYTRLIEKLEQMEHKFQIGTNGTDNENDSDSDSESTIVDNNNIIAPNGALSSANDDAINFEGLVKFFNETIRKHKSIISTIKDIRGKRKDSVRARCRELGKKSMVTVFEKAAKSDFLNGKNDRGFIANFDWLVKPNNFIKVLEGNYDNHPSSKSSGNGVDYTNLIEQSRRSAQERMKQRERIVRETYEAAMDGDKGAMERLELFRNNGELDKYNLP